MNCDTSRPYFPQLVQRLHPPFDWTFHHKPKEPLILKAINNLQGLERGDGDTPDKTLNHPTHPSSFTKSV